MSIEFGKGVAPCHTEKSKIAVKTPYGREMKGGEGSWRECRSQSGTLFRHAWLRLAIFHLYRPYALGRECAWKEILRVPVAPAALESSLSDSR